MTGFTPTDHAHMACAIRLAGLAMATAHPNPRVGCVLAKGDRVVGRGWHERTGAAHAEVNALADAGSEARGSTAYVTLEPCSHHGKTPPCSAALVAAGVGRVVFAMPDPNPKVSGVAALREAGVAVESGLMRAEAEALNRGFTSRVSRGRPFVRLKIAASLDGRTAMASGESRWITGGPARRDVQRLRAESGSIMTGAGTVLGDDPALTVRDVDTGGRQPLRVIMDSHLRVPASAKVFRESGDALVFCCDDSRRGDYDAAGVTVERLAAASGRVDLHAALARLGELEINDLLLECGPALAGAFLQARLVDELVIYLAPHIMGSTTRGIADTPAWRALTDRLPLQPADVRMVGRDIRITARPDE